MKDKVITIIGAGFGGVYVALKLMRQGLRVRIINPDEYFTFTPLLHEVATGMLCESDVRFPIRSFLKSKKLEIVSNSVVKLNLAEQTVECQDGQSIHFEELVIATGARPRQDMMKGSEHAMNLKTIFDAMAVRGRVIELMHKKKFPLRVSVIGGGFTGLELIFELAQLLKIKKCECELHLFERGALPLTDSDKGLSDYIQKRLTKAGIIFHPHFIVTRLEDGMVYGNEKSFVSDLIVVTAGVMPNTELVPTELKDEQNNIAVTEFLNLRSHPNIFALGDIISIEEKGKPPMLAQLAVQQAGIVAKNIIAQLNETALVSYKFSLKGVLVSLGTWDAVGRIFGIKISGRIAWYIWRTVYLFKTPGLKNRLSIAVSWTKYLFKKRSYVS